MTINGTEITIVGFDDMGENEAAKYLAVAKENATDPITKLKISKTENSKVELEWDERPPKFVRIRRITGYLVGAMERWNNAKRAEEHDRVKHGIG